MKPSEAFDILRARYPDVLAKEIKAEVEAARIGDRITALAHPEVMQVVQIVDDRDIARFSADSRAYIAACKLHRGKPLYRKIDYRGDNWTLVEYHPRSVSYLLSDDCYSSMKKNTARIIRNAEKKEAARLEKQQERDADHNK